MNSTTLLIIGLIGIIVVLLFAIATGYGSTTRVVNQKCKSNQSVSILDFYKNKKANSPKEPLSKLAPPGNCPADYTNFTDPEGNLLCCASSNVDFYGHKCPSLGPKGICSMAPGTIDTRNSSYQKSYYPLCQNLIKKST